MSHISEIGFFDAFLLVFLRLLQELINSQWQRKCSMQCVWKNVSSIQMYPFLLEDLTQYFRLHDAGAFMVLF